MTEKNQVDLLKAELLEKIDEIKVLTFNSTNLTTERDVANQEIERLKEELVVAKLVSGPDLGQQRQLTAAQEEIEQLGEEKSELMLKVTGLRATCSNQGHQLTAANAKVERVKDLIHNARASLEEFPFKDWSDHKVKMLLTGLSEALADKEAK